MAWLVDERERNYRKEGGGEFDWLTVSRFQHHSSVFHGVSFPLPNNMGSDHVFSFHKKKSRIREVN